MTNPTTPPTTSPLGDWTDPAPPAASPLGDRARDAAPPAASPLGDWARGTSLPAPPPPTSPQPRSARRSRRGAPWWLVALVGVAGLLLGSVAGGVIGLGAGVASEVFDAAADGDGFSDAGGALGAGGARGGGAVDAGTIAVGQFFVTDLEVQADFADDFFVEATVTNGGSAVAEARGITIMFLAGDEELGKVDGRLPALEAGEAVQLELWGFDAYDASVDRVEITIG